MTRGTRMGICCLWAALAQACGSGGTGTDGADGNNGANGADGKPSLIRFASESPGVHCPSGGTAVQSGLDKNGNGTLEDNEVTHTAYTCNGAPGGTGSPGTPGAQALVRLVPEPAGAHCAQGGTAVLSGLDSNGNAALDIAEVTQTQYVCSSVAAYATGWAASPPMYGTGEIPVGTWLPAGRKVSLFKTRASSQLKLTVSDAFRTGSGVNGRPTVWAASTRTTREGPARITTTPSTWCAW